MAKRKRHYYYDSPYPKATKPKDDYNGGFSTFALKYVFKFLALSWNKLGPGPTIGIIGVPIFFIIVANALSNSASNAVKKVPVPANDYRDMVESQQKNNQPQTSVSADDVVIKELPSKKEHSPEAKAKVSPAIQSATRTNIDPMPAIPKERSSLSKPVENISESVDLMDEFR